MPIERQVARQKVQQLQELSISFSTTELLFALGTTEEEVARMIRVTPGDYSDGKIVALSPMARDGEHAESELGRLFLQLADDFERVK